MSGWAWIGVSLVLAVGAFAILGARLLHPHHRKLAGVVWAASWIPFAISVAGHRRAVESGAIALERAFVGHIPHVGLFALLVLCGYLVRVLFPTDDTVADELDADELAANVGTDLARLPYLLERVDAALHALEARGLAELDGAQIEAETNVALREDWARFVEACFELDILQARYRAFYAVNPVTRTALHARSFLVAYGAYVAEYRAGLLLTRAVAGNDAVQTILDEANAHHDVPADSFLALQRSTVHPDTLLRLSAGHAYLELLGHRSLWSSDIEPADSAVLKPTRAHLEEISDVVESTPELLIDNPLDYLERVVADTWFPVQKQVTVGLSAVHLPSHEYLIGPDSLSAAMRQLEPGDTLLTRREWHLTNLGIPGYWTHAALYLGTLDIIDRYFDDLPELEGRTASEWLRERDARGHSRLSSKDEAGRSPSVIEAVTAGVRVAPFEESGKSDAIAALRPNIPKHEKLRVILDALEHLDKPYDYDFDCATDNTLFCSELVHKAYLRSDEIELRPTAFNGRLLLSPNELCEKFDAEYDTGSRQLDFALFLDGVAAGQIEERGAAELRRSHQRPKWHILVASVA